jgi:hypothetical protein
MPANESLSARLYGIRSKVPPCLAGNGNDRCTSCTCDVGTVDCRRPVRADQFTGSAVPKEEDARAGSAKRRGGYFKTAGMDIANVFSGPDACGF